MGLRSFIRFVVVTGLTFNAFGPPAFAATASEVIPAAAPHGARVIVVGTGLDAPELRVLFSDTSGGTIAAPVLLRTASLLETAVPRGAATGPVRLANASATIATFPFTVTADNGFIAVSTIAASSASHDLLEAPAGIFVDRTTGDVYVADRKHHQVRRFRPDGSSEVIAAQLKEPRAVVFDALRNVLYVADTGNHVIRRLADGVLSVLAGSDRPGHSDGTGTSARFHEPSGLVLDTEGNLYVADSGNHRIRKISPAGVVTTVAGTGRPGDADGAVADARFHAPEGVTIDSDGTLYVADTRNGAVRSIANGIVSTVVGGLREPAAVAVDEAGTLYAADRAQQTIYRIATGGVTAVAGSGRIGYRDGAPLQAEFHQPAGLDFAGALFVSDEKNDALRMIAPAVTVTDFYPRAGKPAGGEAVRIFGLGFVPGRTEVMFGGVPAASVTYVSSTEVIATTPPHAAGDVEIRITSAGGVAVAGRAFRFVQPFVALTVTPASATLDIGRTVQFTATGTAPDGTTADLTGRVVWSSANAAIGTIEANGVARAVAAGTTAIAAAFEGLSRTATLIVRPAESLPPDPATVASPLDPTVVSDMSKSVQFLYTGAAAIQKNVAPGAIDTQRVTVVRGRVVDATGSPLGGVRVSVPGKSQFGFTLTRADGMYDLALNGGGEVVLAFEKSGWIPAQRRTFAPWQDYAVPDDVWLTGYDANATVVQMGAALPQVAQGSVVSDADGERRATLFVPAGTAAMIQTATGTQPAPALTIRATEFSVGPNGPKLMPAALPPTSAYTYCVELSADEAVAANALSVNFSQPLAFYVENFLGFPVGTAVPIGWYDRAKGVWMASDDGVVLKVLTGATVDVTGDDVADDVTNIGVTAEELQQIAASYQPGQTLWRASIAHFTPWDLNFPYMPPPGATAPNQPQPTWFPGVEQPQTRCGSTIDCHNQVFGENIGIEGTPFSLQYQSDHAPGYGAGHSVEIPISSAEVPEPLKRIEVEVRVQGQLIKRSFPASPNQTHRFTWNGLDAYGRDLQGMQVASVRVGYVYDGIYANSDEVRRSFATVAGIPIGTNRGTRAEFTYWQDEQSLVGGVDDRPHGFGGWTLDAVKTLEPSSGIIHAGAGAQRTGDLQGSIIDLFAGGGTSFGTGDGGFARDATFKLAWAVAVAPDGGVYISDWTAKTIRFVSRFGIISTAIASAGSVNAMAVGPDEALYYAAGSQVWRWDRLTRVSRLFAGSLSDVSIDVDEIPALEATLGTVEAIAFGPDGSLYIGGPRIRRVAPDGIIYPVTGRTTLPIVPALEGRSAASTNVGGIAGLTVRNDGTVCFTRMTGGSGRVYAISPSGTIRRFAGTGVVDFNSYRGEGGPAVDAPVNAPHAMASSPDGSVYFGDLNYSTVRRVTPNGIITTVAGRPFGFDASGDGGPATAAGVSNGARRIAVGPDGAVYLTDQLYMTTRRISPPDPLALTGEYRIPTADGQTVDVFSSEGRHLRAIDAITLVTVRQFGYSANRLSTITDRYGNVTRIERDAAGIATAIVSPFGKRTTLTMGDDGYLRSVDNPAGERIEMTYAAGQMKSMKNARGISKSMSYDGDGRLLREDLADGGGTTLTRTGTDRASRVAVHSGEGVVTVHERELDQTSRDVRVDVDPATGLEVTTLRNGDGTSTTTLPDGTIVTESVTADPRFRILAPVQTSSVRTPGGRVLTTSTERSVVLSNKTDPLTLRSITETAKVNGRAWQWTFTKATNVLSTLSPAGRRSTATLNAKGDVASVQIPGLVSSSIGYDPQGRVTSVQTGSRMFTVAWTPRGEVERVTDSLSRTTSYEYDDAGRVKRQTLPDTRTIDFTYDENGNLTSVTPPGRLAHDFDHTVRDLVERYSPPAVPGGGATQYAYDRDGKITRITRPDGSAIVPDYDSSARVFALATPHGAYGYAYSPASGNLTSISEPGGGLLTYTYDGPLVTSVAWSGPVSGTVSRAYDNDLRVSAENGTGYGYDADGLLTRAGALTISRNPDNGLLTGTTLGAITDAYGYNEHGEVMHYEASVGTTKLFSVDYTRDASGRITGSSEGFAGGTAPTETYDYDRAGRLTRVSRGGTAVAEYDYDANSNRTEHRYAGGSASATYDGQDRLLTYGDTTYTYAANGELASRTTVGETTTFGYDALGNLRSVQIPGRTIDYVIDAQNRRIGKKVDGVLVQGWLYGDQLRVVRELDGTGATISQFVYGSRTNVPDYVVKGGVTYRILSDHLGSPRLIVNADDGTIAQQMDFDEFGRVLLDSNPGFQPFGFAGGLYDRDTGLVRFGARDYDAASGRWTSKDPIGFSAGDSNLYGYVFNDPINLIDPSGLAPLTKCQRYRFRKYFPTLDLTKVEIDPEAAVRSGYDGFATNETIRLRPGQYSELDTASSLGLLAHELVHLEQQQEYGEAGFLARYGLEYLRNGYFANAFEVEARRRGKAIENAISREGSIIIDGNCACPLFN